MFSRLFLEKEEDIDIKIRSVSNWKFRFQSQNFGFKLILFVSKCFFAVKISENNQFRRSPGSNDKCRLHRKWCRRHFCFFSCDNRRREYLSQCSLQAGTHTRKLTFQQDSHTRSNNRRTAQKYPFARPSLSL